MLLRTSRYSLMKTWWWVSVPYSLIVIGLLTFSENTGAYLIHAVPPLGLLFWALLRSSIAWTAVSTIMLITRSIPRTIGNILMFGAGGNSLCARRV